MSFGTLGKKITNAFKLHKEANGNMAKLEINLVSDGWKVTSRQSSTPHQHQRQQQQISQYQKENMLP
jgi:hypothetical protein